MGKSTIFGLLLLSHLVIAVQGDLFNPSKRSPRSSAAITIPGLFTFMSTGTSPKYRKLKVKPFEFPKKLDLWKSQIKNERCFVEFLLRNEWVQRKIGIKMKDSNGFFPDIKGEIFDKDGGVIRIEVEYRAENYKAHGHPFGACDLILSFIRRPTTKIVSGCPVWSFYSGSPSSRTVSLCLLDDINFDFLENVNGNKEFRKLKTASDKIFYSGGKWVRMPDVGAIKTKKIIENGVEVEKELIFDGWKWCFTGRSSSKDEPGWYEKWKKERQSK